MDNAIIHKRGHKVFSFVASDGLNSRFLCSHTMQIELIPASSFKLSREYRKVDNRFMLQFIELQHFLLDRFHLVLISIISRINSWLPSSSAPFSYFI